jgi:hypothetical protein
MRGSSVRGRTPGWLLFAGACALGGCALDASGLGADVDVSALDAAAVPAPSAPDAAGDTPADDAAMDAPAAPAPLPDASFDVALDVADEAPADARSDAIPPGCDEDGDGYLAQTVACQGNDCCDTDVEAFPGQTAFFEQPDRCGSYDYDCDGKVTRQYGVVSCQWNVVACSGDGFRTATDCGAHAAFASCSLGVFSCNQAASTRAQACR